MEKIQIKKARQGLQGEIVIPGDKSISHRSVMFSALGNTPVRIKNFLHAQDCMSTAACMEALGAKVEFVTDTELIVTGNGLHGLKEPAAILDAGNSGTTLRLLMGILSAQPFLSTFTGDASLHKRPMGRVIKPLSRMGAKIYGRENNAKLPITIVPASDPLKGMHYDSPVASAQVKSAILLAGMFAEGETTVNEPFVSRDHTEQMLAAFGVKLNRQGTAITIQPVEEFKAPKEIEVPGDISSAAYWLVAGSIVPGSKLLLKNVGINPTRTGILDVLNDMGAKITLQNEHLSGGEAAADMLVEYSELKGVSFGAEIMPRLIDEIPVIAVAALCAKGDTVITGAGELRVKETDRLMAIAKEFNKLAPGAVEEREDGLIIHGGTALQAATAFSYDDHRIAMSLAILGTVGNGVEIENPQCVNISYPEFYQTLEEIQ
ncbi:MAG: 3-phosphoshikimate 1-carboxyvinyltransferase [Selenomonas sp.]|uniref:3-phosphoshikimate 1-carboxyvinyltransferase n=1 Tax=Selenomonas sp. TaxID=2053611 RepID=UPI0025DF2CEE|nr:3-phosphoshikimate 1-carboxyvinyltransferase [Selenomonas sp.]MCR5758070.1 3-phosphoshikimate 1-carboxyvinyltransferase [Selenomonas sp.]